MHLHDKLQVREFEEYLAKHQRLCDCGLPLSEHMPGEEGYTRPALTGNCLNFSDPISRDASLKLAKPINKAPAGWMSHG